MPATFVTPTLALHDLLDLNTPSYYKLLHTRSVMQKKETPSTVRLGPELSADVDRICVDMDVNRSDLIRKAVRHFVARQDHISMVITSARESYARYKTTGRGVDWEETESWINSWGSDDEPEAPPVRDLR